VVEVMLEEVMVDEVIIDCSVVIGDVLFDMIDDIPCMLVVVLELLLVVK